MPYTPPSPVSDTAFGSSWNGVTTLAPSKNAVYDQLHLFNTADDGTILDAGTGFRIGGAAASGKILVGNGTNFVASTPTFPNASATSGKTIRSDGTNWIASTATLSDAPSTAGKHLVSDGTNWITSTPTYPNATATSGAVVIGDGTNFVQTTTPSITATNLTGTADGLTAGDVTRNHAVYAAASPPTVDVGEFTIVKTGIDLKTAATTTVFTVPTSRTFICSYAAAFVTSVTSGGAGTQTFKIQEGGGTAMTPAAASGSGTPVANATYYSQPATAAGGPYKAAVAGVTVQVVIATSHAGSTAVSGSVFVTGKYVT